MRVDGQRAECLLERKGNAGTSLCGTPMLHLDGLVMASSAARQSAPKHVTKEGKRSAAPGWEGRDRIP